MLLYNEAGREEEGSKKFFPYLSSEVKFWRGQCWIDRWFLIICLYLTSFRTKKWISGKSSSAFFQGLFAIAVAARNKREGWEEIYWY